MRFMAFITKAPTMRDILVHFGEARGPTHIAAAAPYAFILTGAPTAFQPEWPTVM
jgi:hypothetical protein